MDDLGQDLRKNWLLEVGPGVAGTGQKPAKGALMSLDPWRAPPNQADQPGGVLWLEAGNLSSNPLPPLEGVNSLTLPDWLCMWARTSGHP